jgi:hypothetical protein
LKTQLKDVQVKTIAWAFESFFLTHNLYFLLQAENTLKDQEIIQLRSDLKTQNIEKSEVQIAQTTF